MNTWVDMTGRVLLLPRNISRIVSLVPSQTELLYDLGLQNRMVGKTVFCIHPKETHSTIDKVGGTKKVRFDKIDELKPDLIICNKEENTPEIVETLAAKYPVWVSDIKDLNDSLRMIESLGNILEVKSESQLLIELIKDSFKKGKIYKRHRTAYLIWRNPYMTVGNDTFIHDMLLKAGFDNVFGDLNRYPEIDAETLAEFKPEVILLSSEPYPFNDKHIDEIRSIVPSAKILLVDGEMFSWYGSRLLNSQPYFNELQRKIHRGINT